MLFSDVYKVEVVQFSKIKTNIKRSELFERSLYAVDQTEHRQQFIAELPTLKSVDQGKISKGRIAFTGDYNLITQ